MRLAMPIVFDRRHPLAFANVEEHGDDAFTCACFLDSRDREDSSRGELEKLDLNCRTILPGRWSSKGLSKAEPEVRAH